MTPEKYKYLNANWVVTKWVGNDPTEIHFVTTPSVTEPHFYRQTTSMDSFRNREAIRFNRAYMRKKPLPVRCHVQPRSDWNIMWSRGRPFADRDPLPEFYHADLWAFYKAIGYDYKNKKYL